MTRKARTTLRRQSPLYDRKGRRVQRVPGSYGFTPELAVAVGDACAEAGCSVRLLVSVAVAKFLRVRIPDAV